MKGKVKFFNKDKGWGFIVGEDGEERFVGARDVIGTDLPENGDEVDFEHENLAKGPKARKVKIISKTPIMTTFSKSDDRVVCPKCKKKIIPRIVFRKGSIHHSVCPFCGNIYKIFKTESSFFESFIISIIFLIIIVIMNFGKLFK